MLEYGIVVILNRMGPNLHEVKILNKVHSKIESTKIDIHQLEKRVDKICLGLLIFLFALYNIGYWIYYL